MVLGMCLESLGDDCLLVITQLKSNGPKPNEGLGDEGIRS